MRVGSVFGPGAGKPAQKPQAPISAGRIIGPQGLEGIPGQERFARPVVPFDRRRRSAPDAMVLIAELGVIRFIY